MYLLDRLLTWLATTGCPWLSNEATRIQDTTSLSTLDICHSQSSALYLQLLQTTAQQPQTDKEVVPCEERRAASHGQQVNNTGLTEPT